MKTEWNWKQILLSSVCVILAGLNSGTVGQKTSWAGFSDYESQIIVLFPCDIQGESIIIVTFMFRIIAY